MSTGYAAHNDGVFEANTAVDTNLLDWWVTHSEDYGYGIFHVGNWQQDTQSYTVDTLFSHVAFAKTFWTAAYGTDFGGFGFITHYSNSSNAIAEVTLYEGATICSWLIAAAADHKKRGLVAWCSISI
ncbi:hypothetical protein PAXINDRAFT_11290 [Paxillus involutus ATCC 200175]|uniref:Uncharacterized protein n=1 Tax=Paxillus involutus ATCC 200175 TaxID=664439 RepID=A0A0C9TJC6_PAXIN|nr:hypothetical protein PAXINDRAFT_11290 [Paxillus involutus ATCC 200175]